MADTPEPEKFPTCHYCEHVMDGIGDMCRVEGCRCVCSETQVMSDRDGWVHDSDMEDR